MEGAIERPACDAQREAVLAQLANLPADTDPADDAGRILADYLGNVGRAWGAATPEERNQIARHLFADVWVVNKTAVAVMPRPEFRPFFGAGGRRRPGSRRVVNRDVVTAEATGVGLVTASR